MRQLDSAAGTALQRRVWQVQRVAWALMALVVVAALLGLLGSGPLSRRSVTSVDGGIRVDYERFLRRGIKTTLRIHARPTNTESSALAVWLARPYLDGARVEGVLPPPRRVQAGRDHVSHQVLRT